MDFTSTGWRPGETVLARTATVSPPPGGGTGSIVASTDATSAGVAVFTDLAPETNFIATGGTSLRRVQFRTGTPRVTAILSMSQADYDALGTPDDSTLYVIIG